MKLKCFIIAAILVSRISIVFAAPAPLLPQLGNYHWPIKTSSKLAQTYFNQGMVLFYGFDYGEAIRSFQGAIATDPKCSMCYVGLALALGSKMNLPIQGNEILLAKHALNQAEITNNPQDKQTTAYIQALKERYAFTQAPLKPGVELTHIVIPSTNARRFMTNLWQMAQIFPNDPNIWSLYAYAIFDYTNWVFWNNQLQPRWSTLALDYAIQKALQLSPLHPGAIHYDIHMLEFSPSPKAALASAIQLGNLYSGAEHLVHMASHVYYILGDYYQAAQQNLRAIQASTRYHHAITNQGFKPITNYLEQHNYYFLLADTFMAGMAKTALQAAISLEQITPIEKLKNNAYLERFYAERYFTIARFGLWQELTKLTPPDKRYHYLTAMWYYVQGLASATHENHEQAQQFLNKLRKLRSKLPETISHTYRRNIEISIEILTAKIATQQHDYEAATHAWENAVNLQFKSVNGDPPSWYLSNHQGLGFAYLRAHDPLAAKFAFEADLIIHPNNGWSLYGLAHAYRKLQQISLAEEYFNKFKRAWKNADVTLPLAYGSDIFMPSDTVSSFKSRDSERRKAELKPNTMNIFG